MSMFHELMMRKKTQIMYATIKGTLTENDGVFSGFSASNYLALQQPFKLNADTVAEICFKAKAQSIITGMAVIGTTGSYGLLLNFTSKLFLYLGDGTSWNILNGASGTTELSLDTDYWFKIIFNKGTVSVLVSVDGVNYITDITRTITLAQEYTYYINYGIGRLTTAYFRGSIDLTNSYIKLGSTKYNLQAVVGYTIVGSPTIVDGVVSGFSSANYLEINVPSGIIYTNIELGFKFKTTDRTKSQRCLFNTGNFYIIQASNIVSVNVMNKNTNNWQSYSGGQITNNEWWWYKIKIDYTTKKLVIERTKDGINFTKFAEISDVPIHDTRTLNTNGVFFGNSDGSQYITLDMNFNYIKINNKLWFNGQQA